MMTDPNPHQASLRDVLCLSLVWIRLLLLLCGMIQGDLSIQGELNPNLTSLGWGLLLIETNLSLRGELNLNLIYLVGDPLLVA